MDTTLATSFQLTTLFGALHPHPFWGLAPSLPLFLLPSSLPPFPPGEIKNLPPPRDLRQKEKDGRDSYVVVALDREEIFRTATAERTLK